MATSDTLFTEPMSGRKPDIDPREPLIDPQLRAAREPALHAAASVLGALALLPQAFLSSQQRELLRVRRSDTAGHEKSPRVAALLASIEQAQSMGEMASHGQARVQRILPAAMEQARVLHGFVSDTHLRPLAGLRVQLQAMQDKPLSATTAEDGYFRIVLDPHAVAPSPAAGSLSALLSRGLAGAKGDPKNARSKAAAAAAPGKRVGNVVLFNVQGERVHEDPAGIVLDAGSVYREYVISGQPAAEPPRNQGGSNAKTSSSGAGSANHSGNDATGSKADTKAERPASATTTAVRKASAAGAASRDVGTTRASKPATKPAIKPATKAKRGKNK